MVGGRWWKVDASGGSGGLLDSPFCVSSDGVQEAHQSRREVVHFGPQRGVLLWREQAGIARDLQVALGFFDGGQCDGDVACEDRL